MLITGCAPTIEDYKDTKPTLVFEDFFNGDVTARGILQGRDGKVTRRFTISMHGKWKDNKGTLVEKFIYDDGEKQQRVWDITRLSNNLYEGTASDIIGVAKGEALGSAIRWSYVMRVPVKGNTYNLSFDDWMFVMPDGTMLNRSTITKFGFKVGEISIFMHKGKHEL